MQTKSENGLELAIIPCSCDSYLGRLTTAAARALQKGKDIHLINIHKMGDLARLKETPLSDARTIAVDGCSERCVKKQLNEKKIDVEFYLNLADLAIEERYSPELDIGDLELARDGITAASVRIDSPFPMFPGCCC